MEMIEIDEFEAIASANGHPKIETLSTKVDEEEKPPLRLDEVATKIRELLAQGLSDLET